MNDEHLSMEALAFTLRELEEARAWMRLAREHLLLDAEMYDDLDSDGSANINRSLAAACPLPPDEVNDER